MLGILRDSETDELTVPAHTNQTNKIKGKKISPDLDLSNLHEELDKIVIKRTYFLISEQLYDPIGLLELISLKTKCVLREACLLKLPWDGTLPENLILRLIESLEDRWREPPSLGVLQLMELQACLPWSCFQMG